MNKPTETYADNTVVSSSIITGNATTVADKLDENTNIALERMRDKEKMLKKTYALGHNLNTSLNGLIVSQTPFKRVIVLQPSTGRFYEKAYTVDDNGNPIEELAEYNPRSVTHLGYLDIDARNMKCSTYYDNETIDLILDDDDTHMPEFYRREWEHPKTEKFVIPPETIDNIINLALVKDE